MLNRIIPAAALAFSLLVSTVSSATWFSSGEMLKNPNFTGTSDKNETTSQWDGILTNWQSTGNPAFYSTTIGGVLYPAVLGRQATYTVRQTVNLADLNYNLALIDSGLARYTASTWQGGWSGDADRGRLAIYFYNELGQLISSRLNPYETRSNFTQKVLQEFVPIGTRRIMFSLEGQRVNGTNLDAYFAKNSLELSAEQSNLAMFGGYFIQGQPVLSDVDFDGSAPLLLLGLSLMWLGRRRVV